MNSSIKLATSIGYSGYYFFQNVPMKVIPGTWQGTTKVLQTIMFTRYLVDREGPHHTRGHRYKLSKVRIRSEAKRNFLTYRATNDWNNLPLYPRPLISPSASIPANKLFFKGPLFLTRKFTSVEPTGKSQIFPANIPPLFHFLRFFL
jgi:hypothetical protein